MESRGIVAIVDDSKTFAMYLGLLLKRMGFEVVPAEDGMTALKIMRVVRPDIIFLDRYMPEMNGTELLRFLKSDQDLQSIPVIMVSTSSPEDLAEEARQHGANGFLTKPVSPYNLHSMLCEHMKSPWVVKRTRMRCSFQREVIVVHEGQRHDLYSVTLSEGGVYLRHPRPLEVGATVDLTISLDDGPIKLAGQVIYQKDVFRDSLRIEPGMAIQFTGLDDALRQRLRKFISVLMAGDLVDEQTEPVLSLGD